MPPHLNVVSKPVCVCVCVCIHLSVCLLLITSQHMVHRPPTVAETLPSAVRLSGVVYWLKCNHRTCLPSPPVDMIIVWRLQGKIIRTVLCCVVYGSCTQWYTHTHEQFLKMSVGLSLGLAFCVFLAYLRVFCSCIVCFCCVGFCSFNTMRRDWLGRTSPKWPILCQLARKPYQ